MAAELAGWQFLRRDFLVGAAAGLTTMRGGEMLASWNRPAGLHGRPTYSQAGEDSVVASIFHYLKIGRPSYLDIGAFLPIYSNNTYLFYTMGGRGVLVEPNVDLIPELEQRRPRDQVLNVGIGLEGQSEADYFCMTLPQWNTFDEEEARRATDESDGRVRIERVVRMPLVPIDVILAAHFPDGGPDYLSIDVEGLDLPILKTMDFDRFRPKLICAETLVKLTARMDPATTDFLASVGYDARAMTFPNTIYVDRRLLG